MTTDPRDTQFASFAQMLRQDIFKHLNWLEFGFTPEQQATIDRAIDRTIAQRAYDLAYHVLDEVLVGPFSGDPERFLQDVSDLTQWPEESR